MPPWRSVPVARMIATVAARRGPITIFLHIYVAAAVVRPISIAPNMVTPRAWRPYHHQSGRFGGNISWRTSVEKQRTHYQYYE